MVTIVTRQSQLTALTHAQVDANFTNLKTAVESAQAAVAAQTSAININFTPVGGIAATNAQAALAELDTEKAPLANPAFTGNVGIGTATPGAKLDVESGSANLNTMFGSTATTTEIALSSAGTTSAPRVCAQGNDFLIKTSGIERVRCDSAGNVGIAYAPKATHVNSRMVQVGSNCIVENYNGAAFNLSQNIYRGANGSFSYVANGVGSFLSLNGGSIVGYTVVSGTQGADATLTQTFIADPSGNLLVGATSGTYHKIYKTVTNDAGNAILDVSSPTAISILFYGVTGTGANSANAAIRVPKDATTNRSINAGGTINASGADYAEYMTKADDCGPITKGQIVGVNHDGKLTDKWASAVSSVIKSTDPSYVGADSWGSAEALGIAQPQEPVFKAPTYEGSPDPGEPQADADKDVYLSLLEKYHQDTEVHDDRVANAREHFDTVTMPQYRAELDAFNVALEAARQRVDRIAYCGQVPVNVIGAQPGDYIVPVQSVDGGISGIAVSPNTVTFDQYRTAVGIVQNILPDGRANVRVKVV